MENSTSASQSADKSAKLVNETDPKQADYSTQATPLRCFGGSLTAGGLAFLAYQLTLSVATTFANKPISSDNSMVVGITTAVRTLVMGMVALGTGVFGVAALGLAALGVQLLLKKDTEPEAGS